MIGKMNGLGSRTGNDETHVQRSLMTVKAIRLRRRWWRPIFDIKDDDRRQHALCDVRIEDCLIGHRAALA
jgi:hypothetical protein